MCIVSNDRFLKLLLMFSELLCKSMAQVFVFLNALNNIIDKANYLRKLYEYKPVCESEIYGLKHFESIFFSLYSWCCTLV